MANRLTNRLLIIKAFVNYLVMRIKSSRLIFGFLVMFIFVFAGCQSAQRRNVEEQIVSTDRERTLARELSKSLNQTYGAWSDTRAQEILVSIVKRIVASDVAYQSKLSRVRVHLLATATPYIAAGLDDIIYVSRGALKGVAYENELAFLLATQLALVKDKVPARNLALLQGESFGEALVALPTGPINSVEDHLAKGWFEPGGLFDFGNDQYLKAEKEGIRLAYGANYDPRGAVTLIQRWNSPSERSTYKAIGKILPDSQERLTSAREEVAKLSPVRDPIVKSIAFDELQSRLQIKKAKYKKAASN